MWGGGVKLQLEVETQVEVEVEVEAEAEVYGDGDVEERHFGAPSTTSVVAAEREAVPLPHCPSAPPLPNSFTLD